MRICYIGKYPPIQGGVSRENYWTAYALAQSGNEVYFVTNAQEVEPRYRVQLSDPDQDWMEPRFERGFVRVFSSGLPEANLAYIPTANPFVTKLASIATQTIREFDCRVIVANYFEPYAVAAFLASQFTGVPFIVKHAGSDLGRLTREPELATTYKEVLKQARRVLTFPRHRERFLAFGVRGESVIDDAPFAVPTGIFNTKAPPLIDSATAYPVRSVSATGSPVDLLASRVLPRIGIYGKVGFTKGSFDLLAALGSLARSHAFNFLAMTGGDDAVSAQFRSAIGECGLADRTYLLPFLPNWRVPSFIRSCSAVCFLERDFPVVIHGPIVAREVLACGVPLILSREIARKQPFREALESGRNVWIVEDPKDHDELGSALSTVLGDESLRVAVGREGHAVSTAYENWQGFAARWSEILSGAVDESRQSFSAPYRASDASEVRDRLSRALPALKAMLAEDFEATVDGFEQSLSGAQPPPSLLPAFVEFLASKTSLPAKYPQLPEVLRYLRISLRMQSDPLNGHNFQFPIPDRARSRRPSLEELRDLRPIISRSAELHEFSSDAIYFLSGKPMNTDGTAAILFNRSQNLDACELQVGSTTIELLQMCDGTRTTSQIVSELAAAAPGLRSDRTEASVCEALSILRGKGVVAFQ